MPDASSVNTPDRASAVPKHKQRCFCSFQMEGDRRLAGKMETLRSYVQSENRADTEVAPQAYTYIFNYRSTQSPHTGIYRSTQSPHTGIYRSIFTL